MRATTLISIRHVSSCTWERCIASDVVTSLTFTLVLASLRALQPTSWRSAIRSGWIRANEHDVVRHSAERLNTTHSITEPVPKLAKDLSRIIEVRSAEREAVVNQQVAVRHV